VSGYQIFMGTSAGGEGATAVASPSGTDVLVGIEGTHLANGTTYFFTVKAVNVVGTGAASNEVSSTPEAVASSPDGLTAAPGGGEVKLSWQAPGNNGGHAITGYDLYQGTAPGAEAVRPTPLSAGVTSRTIDGLTPGVTYYFYVAAVNSAGVGLPSVEVSATPTAVLVPPSPPGALLAARADREVSLNWQAPGSDGGKPVTGYQVFIGTSAGGESSTPVVSVSTTHTVLGLEGTHVANGTTYFFTVKAVSAVGTSAPSNEASATPAPVASAPSGLVATAADGSVKLTWQAPSSDGGSAITGYDIYQGTAPGDEAATPRQVSGTSDTVTSLSDLKTYYFYVAAINSVGPGLPSDEASATPEGAPGIPTGFVTNPGDGGVAISWSPPVRDGGSAVTGYTVLWKWGSHATSSAAVGSTETSYNVTGLTNGDTYDFAVEASNAIGTGPATGWYSSTPGDDAPPLAPEDLTGSVTSANNLLAGTGGGIFGGTSGIVDLRWAAPPAGGCTGGKCAVQGYMLSYFTYTGGHSTLVTSYLAGARSTDSVNLRLNLATDTFDLRAVNSYETGPPAEVKVSLENVPLVPAVVASAYSRQVTLSWADYPRADSAEEIGPITGYAVYEGTSAGKEPTTPLSPAQYSLHITTVGSAVDIQATVTGLDNGTKYYFEVVDIDAGGPSPLSNEVLAAPES
jgi:predicted phage tail protein